MKNIRIGSRLAMGFSMVLSLMVLMTVIGVWRLQDIGTRTNSMIANDLARERLAAEWSANIDINGMRTVALVKSILSSDQDYFKKQIAQTSGRITALQTALDKSIDAGKGRELFNAVLEQRKRYTSVRDVIFAQKASGDGSGAVDAVDQKLVPLLKEYSARVVALVNYQKEIINQKAASVDQEYRSGCLMLASVGMISLLIGAIASWRLAIGITRPLHHAVRITESVAAGNLGTQIKITRSDEIGRLQTGLQAMTQSLLDTVQEVRTGAQAIAAASTEIASGNSDLSTRTAEQASSLEETVSAMEELTSTVQHNADNALEAKQLASSASQIAIDGGAVVGQVVDTMHAINASSNRIVDIISVIDGIAFQTNILALNAAVEAARAGEQGRGFAVVASEVRSLAQRSASAAKEIKTLIGDSVSTVDSGSKLVQQAGQRMAEVVSSVKRVADIVAEISVATQEQSTGISEVNRAITQMDQVTQKNASLVEEAAAAADSLKWQARHLTEVVGVFKFDDVRG